MQKSYSSKFMLHRAKSISFDRLLLLFLIVAKGAALPVLEVTAEKNCNKKISIQKSLNGTIKTNDFPNPYPENTYCEIQFIGNSTHRVIVKFIEFYLHHPYGNTHTKSCDGVDKLQIYDGVRENGMLLGEFCGGRIPKPVMSSRRSLTLNLTTFTKQEPILQDRMGFFVNYTFVSNYGITEGHQDLKDNCSFKFNSQSKKAGNITSPNPGGIYPRNTNCTYRFKGTPQERILLKFQYFDLEGIEPCTSVSGSDYLEFSSLFGYDACPASRCGRFAPEEVVSEGPYFRVKFVSNDKLDGLGFRAEYRFMSQEFLPKWVVNLNNSAVACVRCEDFCFLMFFLVLLVKRFSFPALI